MREQEREREREREREIVCVTDLEAYHLLFEDSIFLHAAMFSDPLSKVKEVSMVLNTDLTGHCYSSLFQVMTCEVIARNDAQLYNLIFFFKLQKKRENLNDTEKDDNKNMKIVQESNS